MKPILVTGATGYIGGRLVPRLLAEGYFVRCLARSSRKLAARPWAAHPNVRIFEGDAGAPDDLKRAFEGCGAAYYLVHSMMAAGETYRARDRALAEGFALAAESAGAERIVYLGGLGETGDGLSEHLTSRREVEQALASGRTPTTVLRAAMIIGSGSASFEILRYLVERLPLMITPRWVKTESQPIAVSNVLHSLVRCLAVPETAGRALDIGGPDILSYRDLMQLTAEALGLRRRLILPVPVLTPRLSSLWIHLVTPISARIARPLAEGLRNRVVCRNDEAARLMPQRLIGVREAIHAAVERGAVQPTEGEAAGSVETAWSDAGPLPGDPDWAGGTVLTDRRSADVAAPPAEVFRAFCRLGGARGYHAANGLWRLRGFLDRLVGGPGLRRGRRDPERLAYGDALDFWRVVGLEQDRRLVLRAEMKLPGEAELEFEAVPSPSDPAHTRLLQTARFKPRGIAGITYWYSVLPVHGLVFRGMLEGIRRDAEANTRSGSRLVPEDRPVQPD